MVIMSKLCALLIPKEKLKEFIKKKPEEPKEEKSKPKQQVAWLLMRKPNV